MKTIKNTICKIIHIMHAYIILGVGVILVSFIFFPAFPIVDLEVFLGEGGIVGMEITNMERPYSFIWANYITVPQKISNKELEIKLFDCKEREESCLIHDYIIRGVEKGYYHIDLSVLYTKPAGRYYLITYLYQYEDSDKKQVSFHSQVFNWGIK